MSECRSCGGEILWINNGNGWVALEPARSRGLYVLREQFGRTQAVSVPLRDLPDEQVYQPHRCGGQP